MSDVENIQVVEVNSMDISGDDYDVLCDFYQGDEYGRYYPDPSWTYIKAEVKDTVNKALLKAGAVFPEDSKNFYVLIRMDD